MSRSVAWRNKPTPFLLQMVEEAKNYKLYLVSQTGPTSFVFKDDRDNKFKVSIGSKLSCSCGVIHNDHCIHTLYVLLKKYKVDENNPILWQASYLDSQLQGLIQGKYSQKKKKPTITHKYIPRKKQQVPNDDNNSESQDDLPPPNDDDSCPICYQNLKGQCISHCGQCHNYLHTKCFKVWIKHKNQSSQAVTCPMCRNEFDKPMMMVAKDLEKWASRFLIHKGTKCMGCGQKNIKGLLFRCLVCPVSCLCRLCFQDLEHSEHDRFIMKQQTNGEWVMAPSRAGAQSQLPIYKSIHQKEDDKLEDMFKKQNEISKNPEIFFKNFFPTLREAKSNQTQPLNMLGIIGNQVKLKLICNKCGQPGSDLMRKLFCGHTVHEQCLSKMLKNSQFQCEVDGQIIAKGYFSTLGIKPQKKIKKNMVQVFMQQQDQQSMKIKKKLQQPLIRNPLGGPDLTLTHSRPEPPSRPPQPNHTSYKNRSQSIKKTVLAHRQQDLSNQMQMQMPMMIVGFQGAQVRARSVFRQSHF